MFSSEQLRNKARVRRRDGCCCVVCGMDKDTHKKRYGQTLDVHRIVPGSEYDLHGCATLCDVCHDALHEKGNWAWVIMDAPEDEEELARRVRESIERDLEDVRTWRRRAGWGAWLRDLREAWAKVTEEELARSAEVPIQTLKNWQDGRAEPLLSEAIRLATALNSTIKEENEKITIYELSCWNPEPDDEWLKSAQRQSEARAMAFRPRKPNEAEDLGPGAKLVREVVERAYQMRVTINRAKAQDHGPPPKRLRG